MACEQMALAFTAEPFISRTAMNPGLQAIAVCRNCQREFVTLRKQVVRGQAIFCSRSCHSADICKRRNADQRGEKNPHWKGGVSTDGYRYVKRFMAKSPEKVAVHRLFKAAVEKGLIVRPDTCSACGVTCTPAGHHDDYSKPYEVRWLCQPCHNKHHAALRKVG